MIPLDLGQFATLYAAACVGGILILWLILSAFRLRGRRRATRRRIQCALCGTDYEDGSAILTPTCPICHHPNERTAAPFV